MFNPSYPDRCAPKVAIARHLSKAFRNIALGVVLAASAACGRNKTQPVGAELAAGEVSISASTTQAASKVKAKAVAAPPNRGPGLIYRQAGEQARQHLTAENAHLRLDELETQIEHEQENSR